MASVLSDVTYGIQRRRRAKTKVIHAVRSSAVPRVGVEELDFRAIRD